MGTAITEFQGEHRYLSNFWPAPIAWCGIRYPSTEHAYQAAKTNDRAARLYMSRLTAGQAKRYGRTVAIRPDWEAVKVDTMREIVTLKFSTHAHLAAKMLATGDAMLIEGNTWGDTFWGVCRGRGENHLGKILMSIRSQLGA